MVNMYPPPVLRGTTDPFRPVFLRGPTIRAQGRRTTNGQQDPQDLPPSYMEVMRGIIMSGESGGSTGGSTGGSPRGPSEAGPENSVTSPTSIFTVEEQFMRELEDQQRAAAAPPPACPQNPAGQSGRSQQEGQGGERSEKISTVQVVFGFSLLVHMVQSIVVLCWLFIFGSGLYMTDDLWAGAFAVFFFFAWVACETYFVRAALEADRMSDIRKFNYWMKYLEVLISVIVIVVITLFFRDPQKLNSSNCLFLASYFILYGFSYLFADLRLQEVKNETGAADY